MRFIHGFMNVVFLLSLTACVTRPFRSERVGLFERKPAGIEQKEILSDRSGRSERAEKINQVNGNEFAKKYSNDDSTLAKETYSIKPGKELFLKGDWQWPLKKVEVSSSYGQRKGRFHQGIDLHAPLKTQIFAASDGEVVYVGTKIRGYGRMIVIKHKDNYYTVYAHHSQNLVKLGKQIEKGELIAYSGRSGRSSGPHLHFEIRRGTQSFDPEYAFNSYFKLVAPRQVATRSKLMHDHDLDE